MIKIIEVLKVRHKQIDRALDGKREIKREREKEKGEKGEADKRKEL